MFVWVPSDYPSENRHQCFPVMSNFFFAFFALFQIFCPRKQHKNKESKINSIRKECKIQNIPIIQTRKINKIIKSFLLLAFVMTQECNRRSSSTLNFKSEKINPFMKGLITKLINCISVPHSTQLAFTCSKLSIERSEKCMKSVQN